ncbi:hypothetical protein ACEPAH_1947 [Sanghuangporus vaninii]
MSGSTSRRSANRSSAYGSGKPAPARESGGPPQSRQRSRSVRDDGGGDYDYGFMNDEDGPNNRRMPLPGPGRPRAATLDAYTGSGLPQPATAPNGEHGALPWGYVIMPQKEKKTTFTRRLRNAFASATANPDVAALGFTPGRPTPQHLLDREEEEVTLEEEKREEERRRKEELVRQSNLRRAAADNARRKERLAQEVQKHGRSRGWSQPDPRQVQGPSSYDYNARIAEEYARERAKLREFDDARKPGRISTQPSKYARQQYLEQQAREQRARGQSISHQARQTGREYDYELDLLREYDQERDGSSPPPSAPTRAAGKKSSPASAGGYQRPKRDSWPLITDDAPYLKSQATEVA